MSRIVLQTRITVPEAIYQNLVRRYPGLSRKCTIELIGTLQIAERMITERNIHAYKALYDSAYGRTGWAK